MAAFFGKQHAHVLRDIDVILGGSPDWDDRIKLMFELVNVYDDRANKNVRSFDMSRDGFTLLVMRPVKPQ